MARGKTQGDYTDTTREGVARTKKAYLALVREGYNGVNAAKEIGRSYTTIQNWLKRDPSFRAMYDQMRIISKAHRRGDDQVVPDFPEFCERYLGTKLFRHQLQWYDLLEGREPRDLSSNQIYVPGETDMILINTPPEHSKSTTITVNYVTWRICQDPNVRIVIVSKTQEMAKKFLLSIKERLAESDTYETLQQTFGPQGGFAESAAAWTADKIYCAGRDAGEKDPTVWALGLKGHIYGARADLVILDDCIDHTNHQDYVKQIDWLQNMVGSRVADSGGKMLVIGTRIESVDLYSELMKSEYYMDEASPWTYLTQPAVESYADKPEDWVTLWPVTNRAPVTINGRKAAEERGWPRKKLWPAWDGSALARKRQKMSPRNWSLVYMQEQVADDAVFASKDVTGCIDESRQAGPLIADMNNPDHRKWGMEGLFIIAGLDPADTGRTAAVCVGLDRQSGHRWILDVFDKQGCRPHEMRQMIREWTDRYGVMEWRIEKNAFQGSIVQDEDLRSYLHGRGCVMTGHFTGGNKWDPNFGIASMAPLFQDHERGRNLIRLPSRYRSEGTKQLVEQLVTWNPVPGATKRHTQTGHWDCVMSLWFAEIRCRELMQGEYSTWHMGSEFTSERDSEKQMVVDIDYALAQGSVQGWDGRLGW